MLERNELIAELARNLSTAGLQVTTDSAIGPLPVDLAAVDKTGFSLAVIYREWRDDSALDAIARAQHQIGRYRELTKVDLVCFLGPDERNLPGKHPYSTIPEIMDLVRTHSHSRAVHRGLQSPSLAAVPLKDRPTVFAAMPFASRFDDTYFVAMVYAAEQVGCVCDRVDQEYFSGPILDRICYAISHCELVVCRPHWRKSECAVRARASAWASETNRSNLSGITISTSI